jgi:uncharacterized BrkB/YihY/UPF0761 family membrane protein
MLAVTATSLTIRYWAQSRPWWFLFLTVPVLIGVNFVFFLVSPRLLLHLPFEWRHLVPGAGICVVANAVVVGVSVLLMRRWLSAYGHAYGGFGIALGFLAWIGLLATFWVWIGAIAGVYWERFAGATQVAEIEEMSRAGEPGAVGHALSAVAHETFTQAGRIVHPDVDQDRQPQDDAAQE